MFYTNRIEIKYSLVTLALLIGLMALDRAQAFSGLDTFIDDFFDLMTGFGFVGFFIVAVIGNSTVLLTLPYTVPLLSLALGGASLNHLLLMGIASGMGAAVGELISYGMALKILGLNPDLEKSKLFQWVKRLVDSHPRTAPLVVFIWAISPLPDDTVIIPLAMIRYGINRMMLPLFTGKIAHNLVIAAVFYYSTTWSANHFSASAQVDLALGILILFVMVILYQIEKTRAMRCPCPVK